MKQPIKTNLYLIKELTKREISSKYKGSWLGMLWVFLTPLAMLVVFTFVFGEIFQAKWPGDQNQSMLSFSINLFVGLGFFWFFADILGRSTQLFVSNVNYVKKVIFPLEVLPVVSLLSGLFHLCIHIAIIIGLLLIVNGTIGLSIIALPLIIFVSIPMLIGLGLLLGSVGVFVRDLGTIIGVSINMLMFLSPVFYPLSAIPAHLQWLFHINPLTVLIQESRTVLVYDQFPNWGNLGIYFIISLGIYFMGYTIFRMTKKGFADVL